MSFDLGDQPLGEQFQQNPYDYFQRFIRGMNNEVFLSEYQLGHLYSLLLLNHPAPWQHLKNTSNTVQNKKNIEELVQAKQAEVKMLLQSLSQLYEDKVKKNTFNRIERLMSIIKANNKSIYIEKSLENLRRQMLRETQKLKIISGEKINQINTSYRKDQGQENFCSCHQRKPQQVVSQFKKEDIKNQSQLSKSQNSNPILKQLMNRQSQQNLIKEGLKENQQGNKIQQKKQKDQEEQKQPKRSERKVHQGKNQEGNGQEMQIMSIFYGMNNLNSLSALALSNCLEYSSSQRYIRFKMSENYIMTIKNEDEPDFDHSSQLRNVPVDLMIQGVFPYLTAVELFKIRGVCKEWRQNVKQAWHSTFKREMFVQLMACEYCKEIQHYYKLIQLRNPFFQKISLLMHALLQIIQWQSLYINIAENNLPSQIKKVLMIYLKLIGQKIQITNLNSITEEFWLQNKHKLTGLKEKIATFLSSNLGSSSSEPAAASLTIDELFALKRTCLDDPFMRVQQLNSEDKTPLLLVIFIKQLTLQQILKNHIFFSQEYLMNTKQKLDNVSLRMPQQKGFLQMVYKILLLRNISPKQSKLSDSDSTQNEMPNFHDLITSLFGGQKQDQEISLKPDFVIRSNNNVTNIYLDKPTKLDIIVSTMKRMNLVSGQTNSEEIKEQKTEKSHQFTFKQHKDLEEQEQNQRKENQEAQKKIKESKFE